jgi:hypothetical protein
MTTLCAEFRAPRPKANSPKPEFLKLASECRADQNLQALRRRKQLPSVRRTIRKFTGQDRQIQIVLSRKAQFTHLVLLGVMQPAEADNPAI